MANLNLSEFGEKLFVADADHTFIWDTANAISKRVSRNSWLNSGTLTSDAPVTISQTWNQIGTAFTAFKVNAVSTNSASGSLLLDLQLGGVSLFKVSKTGSITANNTFNLSGSIVQSSGNIIPSNALIFDYFNQDVVLQRDAANTLALRNGALPQTFNVYGTWTTAITNFERLAIKYNTTDVAYQIAAEKGSTNGDYRPLQLVTGGASRLHITTAGNVGIGTTAPSTKLDVVGLFQVSDGTTGKRGLISSIDSVSAFISPSFWGAGGTYVPLHLQTSEVTRLAITTAGNVGIGTTSPSSKLQVSAGDVEVDTIAKGVILKSPDGTRYRVTVANGGTLSVAAV